MTKSKPTAGSLNSIYDFNLCLCTEKRKDNGEDAVLYSVMPDAALACSLDGCGGSGAKQYPKFQNKTGAYMASRVAFGAVKDWFLETDGHVCRETAADELKQKILSYLQICNRQGGEVSRFKGNISKDFPTTVAIELCTANRDFVDIQCLWAGDSRCYLLTPAGLMQLSDDDLDNYDAMENLFADGVLTNVISASKDFQIHSKVVTIHTPCIAFTATDGCFGYYSTPMEFEFLLLDTLAEAASPMDWEHRIVSRLSKISGDDFTVSGFSLGFGTFDNLKSALAPRHRQLYLQYIEHLEQKSPEQKMALWQCYRPFYSQFLTPRPAPKPSVSQPIPKAAVSSPVSAAPAQPRKKPILAPPDELE